MTLEIKGAKSNARVFRQMAAMPKNFKKGLRIGFEEAADAHHDTIVRDLNDKASKEGLLYLARVRGTLIKHRASAPGQTAATLSGDYERSVGTKVSGGDTMSFGAGVDYAKKLELGFTTTVPIPGLFLLSRSGSKSGTVKVQPRPSLTNTVKKEERNTRLYLGKNVFRALIK